MAEGIEFDTIASRTEGATGADIKAMVTEAGMFAIRDNRDYVTMQDFEAAIDKVFGESLTRKKEPGVMYA